MIITAQDGTQIDIPYNSVIKTVGNSVVLFRRDGYPIAGLGSYRDERIARFATGRAIVSIWEGEDYRMPGEEEADHQRRETEGNRKWENERRRQRTRTFVWVPVEEYLPIGYEDVLVTVKDDEGVYITSAVCEESGLWLRKGGRGNPFVEGEVLAWADMPEPYKCKDEREEES